MSNNDVKRTLAPLLRNKYIITAVGFLIWMSFIDDNNLITRYRLSSKLSELEREKKELQASIEHDRNSMQELLSGGDALEKFAREKYYMKRDNEVIFIVR